MIVWPALNFDTSKSQARAVRMLAIVEETLREIPDTAREPELRRVIREARYLAQFVLDFERDGK